MISDKRKRELKANVRRGCRVLDRKRPNWFMPKNIHITRLDLSSPRYCVIGELEGYYSWDNYEKYTSDPGPLGFTLWGTGMEDHDYAEWAYLTELWKDAIRARRKAKANG